MRKRARQRNIGMLEVADDRDDGFSPVFGAWVVMREAITETIRNIGPDRIQLYAEDGEPLVGGASASLHSLAAIHRFENVDFRDLKSLRDQNSRQKIDHWHDFPGTIRPFQLRRALNHRQNFPISISHHTVSYQEKYHHFFLNLLLEDVRPYDSLICASTAARDAIQNIIGSLTDWFRTRMGGNISYRGRLDVLPLGVKTDAFRPRDKADARNQFELPRNAFIILWVGRLSERDKADLLPLLRVFRQLLRANKSKDLLLVLAGSELDRNVQGAQLADYCRVLGMGDRVRILTSVPPAYRHLLFACADIFVSPSDNIQETFGLTPIEAMACGVPQVVSDWNGYRDTVRHGETGFLIPTRWMKCDQATERFGTLFEANRLDHLLMAQTVVVDLESLQKHLQLLLDRPQLRARMAEASRQRALQEYSWPVIVRRLRELWNDQEEQRRSIEPDGVQHERHYTDPKFFEYFKGYARTILTGDETVRLTEGYRRVAYDGEPLPYYYGKEWGFRKEVFLAIVAVLERAMKSKTKRSISEIEDKLARSGKKFEPELVRQHVMWLLKYGYLRLETKRR